MRPRSRRRHRELLGANRAFRRPVAAGAGAGVLASLATWFVAVAALGAVGGGSLDVQAATGLLAVVVLLVVMNWFFHRVYWTGWIAGHHRRRRRLLDEAGAGAGAGRAYSPASPCSASRASTARASRSCCSCRACV